MAREAAAGEIDGAKNGSANCSDILVSLRARPVLREHGAAKRVLLHLPNDGTEPGPFQAKLKAADAREERADRQHDALLPSAAIQATIPIDVAIGIAGREKG